MIQSLTNLLITSIPICDLPLERQRGRSHSCPRHSQSAAPSPERAAPKPNCRGPWGAACPGPPRGRPALSIGLRADSSPRFPRALSGQSGLRCAVGPLARRRGSARAAAVSGGGAGRAVHRRERCTGVDSREWIATTKRAHTFGLPADHTHQTHQWHVQAIMSPFTVNQPIASQHP